MEGDPERKEGNRLTTKKHNLQTTYKVLVKEAVCRVGKGLIWESRSEFFHSLMLWFDAVVCVPQNFMCWKPNPQILVFMVFAERDLGT